MKKNLIEFINVCAWCDTLTPFVEELGKKYKDHVDVKIYKAGKDFDYIRKYGMFNKSVLIVDEKKVIDNVNKSTVEKTFMSIVGNI